MCVSEFPGQGPISRCVVVVAAHACPSAACGHDDPDSRLQLEYFLSEGITAGQRFACMFCYFQGRGLCTNSSR